MALYSAYYGWILLRKTFTIYVFKMDVRKSQGYARYLGTREVLGYISINGENNNLKDSLSSIQKTLKITNDKTNSDTTTYEKSSNDKKE